MGSQCETIEGVAMIGAGACEGGQSVQRVIAIYVDVGRGAGVGESCNATCRVVTHGNRMGAIV